MAGKYAGLDKHKARKKPYDVTPGGKMGPGGWMLTPDQRDRNGEHSLREYGRRRPRSPVVAKNQQWT